MAPGAAPGATAHRSDSPFMSVMHFRCALPILTLVAAPVSLEGQGQPVPSISRFVEVVRAATVRYQDQATAQSDGYRRMGPDVPSMGQHWISLARVARGPSDPRSPPILEYARIGGELRLIGVGYARMLPEGVTLEETTLPAPVSAWRIHLGDITEEGLVLTHADNPVVSEITVPRLAVLHAWVWQPNPEGLFATDNWSLPYIRLGLEAPADPRPTPATMALALASGAESYFHMVLRLRYQPRPSEALRTAGVLTRYARAIRETVSAGTSDSVQLAAQWKALDTELRAACPTCNRVAQPLLTFQPGGAPVP